MTVNEPWYNDNDLKPLLSRRSATNNQRLNDMTPNIATYMVHTLSHMYMLSCSNLFDDGHTNASFGGS
jgi:hypothetical protein